MTFDDVSLLVSARIREVWRRRAIVGLSLLVGVTYFARLTAMPVCGEESRWGGLAREMIATGDWIVPRQQGEVFPERPPLTSWAMALVGLVRGDVDLAAVRLPSACAMLALTLLIYAYASRWMTPAASFAAAAIFATGGQVLALGRAGESEAVFSLFVAGSMLLWHWGYLDRWPRGVCWTIGYGLAALGALAKGLQAPVYFAATCYVFLLLRRDWRWLFCGGHLLGLAAFAGIVGAWFVPFALVDFSSIDDIWAGLVQDRFTSQGLARHLATYPFEILGCMLPWSPLLLPLVKPGAWKSLLARRPQLSFLLVALAVTFPSVWFAAGARGRYFMPLYPCLAILMALTVEHCTAVGASLADRLIWRRVMRSLAVVALAAAGVVAAASLVGIERLALARQTPAVAIGWIVMATTAAALLFWAAHDERPDRVVTAVATLACFAGLTQVTLMVDSRVRGANDLSETIAQIKRQMPYGSHLVSLDRVYHRFAYCYAEPIRRIGWPERPKDMPPDVTYFCFDYRPWDNAERRISGDGRTATLTSGTLPFEWEKIAEIPCDPVRRAVATRYVIVGRVRKAERVAQQ